ncbi:MAG: hypothetical protein ACOCPM_00965 [Bacteroidales bacterium]
MKYFSLLPLLIFFVHFGNAQSVLLEESVDYYEDTTDFGPNRTHYYHFYGSYGHLTGASQEDKSKIDPLLSNFFDLGARYKRRFSQVYSMGYEVSLNNRNFHLADSDSRNLPDNNFSDKEKINVFSLAAGIYSRFNVGMRGNYIGNFMDIGVFGGWNFNSRYYYKNEYKKGQYRKYSEYNPDYVKALNYGVLTRIGYNNYVLFARYRFSDMINTEEDYKDLPPFTLGVQIGFHK